MPNLRKAISCFILLLVFSLKLASPFVAESGIANEQKISSEEKESSDKDVKFKEYIDRCIVASNKPAASSPTLFQTINNPNPVLPQQYFAIPTPPPWHLS